MARKGKSFRAVLNECRSVGDQWLLDTSRGMFVMDGPVRAQAPRLAEGATYGHTYQVSLNGADRVRFIQRLYR